MLSFYLLSGCRVEQFAQLYAKKVGVSATVLQQTLWGDYYLDSKTKTVKKGAQVSMICWRYSADIDTIQFNEWNKQNLRGNRNQERSHKIDDKLDGQIN